MSEARRKALTVLAGLAVVLGVACAINGLSHPFAADAGQQLGGLFAMNTFGGILTAGLGLITILGIRDDQPNVVLGAGAVFLLGAFITERAIAAACMIPTTAQNRVASPRIRKAPSEASMIRVT